MFPLYSHLRYERAKKLGRPGEEVERNLLYKRMSWALIVCYAVAGGIAHAILKVALPGYGYVGELQFVLTTLSLAIASAGCLWSVGR